MVKSRSNGGLEGVGVSFSDVNLSLIFLSYLVAIGIRLPCTLLQITFSFLRIHKPIAIKLGANGLVPC